ncbi:hypothetical protein [Thermococcus sp.]|uniref:hypothetical protein n=1 Tax=Thermococcus sp. TaxID=35749 RepID=UPI0026346ED0|nr:hypothetical protein [Thermococcus sp.]
MSEDCVKYFKCVWYHNPKGTLRIETHTKNELARLVKRRRLMKAVDRHTIGAVVSFIKNELVKRGMISEASMINAVLAEHNKIEVYYNGTSILIAVVTYATFDCFLNN